MCDEGYENRSHTSRLRNYDQSAFVLVGRKDTHTLRLEDMPLQTSPFALLQTHKYRGLYTKTHTYHIIRIQFNLIHHRLIHDSH